MDRKKGVEFVSSIALVSEQPERLLDFYHAVLGVEFRSEEFGRPQTFHLTHVGRTQLSIHPAANFPGSRCGVGAVRIAFETRDLDAMLQHARSHGAQVRIPVQRRGPGIRIASFDDPDGNEITLTERPRELPERLTPATLGRRVFRWLKVKRVVLKKNVQLGILDAVAYHRNRISLAERDLRPFTHVVASREGAYAINRERFAKIVHGQFFGITVRGSALYLFQANGPLISKVPRGRILRLEVEGGFVRGAEVVARGLDNGCHQIDFLGDRLVVVDTYNQAIVILNEKFEVERRVQPLGPAALEDWKGGYAHVNSILGRGDEIYLLKQNGGTKTGKNSELVRCDRDFNVRSVTRLPGGTCHNIVFLEEGRLLVCDSRGGTLVDEQGVVADVGPGFLRGLSVDRETVVVGESKHADRWTRRLFAGGNVYFFDRRFQLLSKLSLPGAPKDIRKIDGDDLALSRLGA